MRARSAKQRFPVAQWVEDLEILQSTSIRIYNKTKTEKRLASPSSPDLIDLHTPRTITPVVPSTDVNTTSYFSNLASPPPPQQRGVLNQQSSLGTADGPGHVDIDDCNDGRPESATLPYRYSLPPLDDFDSGSIRRDLSGYTEPESNLSRQCTQHCPPKLDNEDIEPDLETSSVFDIEDDGAVHMARPMPLEAVHMARPMSLIAMRANLRNSSMPSLTHGSRSFSGHSSLSVSRPPTLSNLQRPAMPARIFSESDAQDCLRCMCARCSCFSSQKTLCVEEIVEGKTDFCLQKVDPFFTDSNGIYHRIFQKKLKDLSATNSETSNCIEEYLVDSEKEWFNTFRNAKLGISKSEYSVPASIMEGVEGDEHSMQESIVSDEFLLGSSYSPPKGFRKWLSIRVGDWPIYAILLGLGQIMAANSYQITLLTGEVGQTATKLYIIASIYLAASAAWWMCFRRYQSVVSLSAPFFVYGLAFLCIGIGPWVSYSARFYVQNLGAGFYTVASASGSLYFALNFGDEGGSKVQSWVFRACVIQGTQQIYIASLWYWGSALTHATAEGLDNTTSNSILGTFKITAITIPIVILLWIIGFVLSIGLPKYYRQAPGKVPAFYRSAMKRKIIKWFFVMAVVQNFFMSAPYGRNWTFLFSSQHVKPWQVLCLAALFFIGVWAGLLAYLAHLTKKHSWILPLFAIGLGAPRFAQIWWGTSNIGLYLPWAGTYAAGAMVSRALWLWLGVLDAIQGVGLGMMMLGTLTRMHVAFAVMATQCVGSIATILARAVAPNRIGPGPISPDLSGGIGALWTAWFWVALAANLLLCVGFYKFYRKEQLQKP